MGMGALCPSCGQYHEVIRTLEEGQGDSGNEVFQVSSLAMCERTWMSDKDLLEASARFGMEAMLPDSDDVE